VLPELLTTSEFYLAPLAVLAVIPVYALWVLPSIAWCMAVSAWAKRAPFLWAVGTPVLAGILLPAVSLVREAARTSVCASNMRQIGLALSNYQIDNDGLLPPQYLIDRSTGLNVNFQASIDAGKPTHYWFGAIMDTLDDSPGSSSRVYSCPASCFPNPASNGWSMSFAYNNSPWFWNRLDPLTRQQQQGFSPARIPRSQACVFLAERWAAMVDGVTPLGGWGVVPPYDATRPAMSTPLKAGGNPNALRVSHNRGSNYLVLDMHVERVGTWDRIAAGTTAANESSAAPNLWIGAQ
jgi:hypothetical protein